MTEPSLANSTQSEVQDEPGPAAGAEARFEPGQLLTDRKVGICKLPWESAAREALNVLGSKERGWEIPRLEGSTKSREEWQKDGMQEELSKSHVSMPQARSRIYNRRRLVELPDLLDTA